MRGGRIDGEIEISGYSGAEEMRTILIGLLMAEMERSEVDG